ncbi:MAG TPA: hypothetical protein VLB74_06980 [Flavobacterium sp.]|uniref:hypothetical protein n=1 Tax=Flavobacterium sp. TaxID=239 RepID=UPI002BAEC6DE|nr:hypothetical protein [Flavobacterium sp.]HSD14375.1 hypothetical protein [Flavobacterium sp.]
MKLNLLLTILFFLPSVVFSQDITISTVKTNSGDIKIPGKWTQLNTMDDSGQTYLKNDEGIIIAIAQNPKKAYPFFKSNKSDFENVKEFYKWDSDYRKENNFKTEKLKENSKSEYVIWKYNDQKLDNVFLFGSSKSSFLNFLVYTNLWSEDQKIEFLEKLHELNK